MLAEYLAILEGLGIALGLVLAFLGLFHQIIVGAAASMFSGLEGKEIRLVAMSWIAHGAFLSFCGILPAVLLFFHGLNSGAAQTSLLLNGAALIFLSIHVFISKLKGSLRPLKIEAYLQLLYGAYLVLLVILSYPGFP